MLYIVRMEQVQHEPALLKKYSSEKPSPVSHVFLSKLRFKKKTQKKTKKKKTWQAWVFTALHARSERFKQAQQQASISFLILCITPPPPHLHHWCSCNWVWHGINREKRGRIWMRKMSSSYFSLLTPMPSTPSPPVCAAATMATSLRPHPPLPCICFH